MIDSKRKSSRDRNMERNRTCGTRDRKGRERKRGIVCGKLEKERKTEERNRMEQTIVCISSSLKR